jgi:hypothetical protein
MRGPLFVVSYTTSESSQVRLRLGLAKSPVRMFLRVIVDGLLARCTYHASFDGLQARNLAAPGACNVVSHSPALLDRFGTVAIKES